ncbi:MULTISPECIES: hypothetical protein [unclassified Bradyrhizobium]|uniref:hypothetical protein n=1 Tax=unclassified Bradyrhizobium TaxID=2631580 RepID=UPI001FFBD77C|nr:MULTISPECIES: hypothetical protein [unclassified Bradyrhizobium]
MLLVTGFGLVVVDLGLTAWLRPTGPASFVLVGLASLCATAAFGAVFVFACGVGGIDRRINFGVRHPAPRHRRFRRLADLDGHGCQLPAPGHVHAGAGRGRPTEPLAAGALAVGVTVAGGILAIGLASGLSVVLSIAAVFGLASAALYARDIAGIFRTRKRRQLELNMRMATLSFASLAATAMLGSRSRRQTRSPRMSAPSPSSPSSDGCLA